MHDPSQLGDVLRGLGTCRNSKDPVACFGSVLLESVPITLRGPPFSTKSTTESRIYDPTASLSGTESNVSTTPTSTPTPTLTPTPTPSLASNSMTESSPSSSSQSQDSSNTTGMMSPTSSFISTIPGHSINSTTSPPLSSGHSSSSSSSSSVSFEADSGLGNLSPKSTSIIPTSSAASPTFTPQEAPSQPTPKQALTSNHSSRAGPIAGGVISGLLIVAALLLLWFYRRKILNRWSGRHRVAPSSEFLNAGIRALTPRDGMLGAERQQRVMSMHEGSRTVLTGPYVVTQHIRRSSSAPPSNPLPSPPGLFADRLGNSQWLNDASRRREELYQATTSSGSTDSQQDLVASAYPRSPPPLMVHYTPPASYPSSPRDVSSHARQESGTTVQTSHEGSGRRNSDPFQDQSDSEEDMQTTSRMLSPSKVTRVDGQADAATGTNVTVAEGIAWAV